MSPALGRILSPNTWVSCKAVRLAVGRASPQSRCFHLDPSLQTGWRCFLGSLLPPTPRNISPTQPLPGSGSSHLPALVYLGVCHRNWVSPKICSSSQPFWANYSCIYLRSRAISSPHPDPSYPPVLQCCPVPNLGPFMPTHHTVPPATQHSGHLPPAEALRAFSLEGQSWRGSWP